MGIFLNFALFYLTKALYHCSLTVVQSYFIYWAGIESPVLRDRSRHPLSQSKSEEDDKWNVYYSQQQSEDTDLLGKDVFHVYIFLNVNFYPCVTLMLLLKSVESELKHQKAILINEALLYQLLQFSFLLAMMPSSIHSIHLEWNNDL